MQQVATTSTPSFFLPLGRILLGFVYGRNTCCVAWDKVHACRGLHDASEKCRDPPSIAHVLYSWVMYQGTMQGMLRLSCAVFADLITAVVVLNRLCRTERCIEGWCQHHRSLQLELGDILLETSSQ